MVAIQNIGSKIFKFTKKRAVLSNKTCHRYSLPYHTSQIAEAMEISSQETQFLEAAALLLDVGKTEIPVNILTKNSPLTLKEYWLVQAHPFFSEMLTKPLDKKISSVIKKHHERIDGRGYPGGWKEEEICLSARILSVADSYAAMHSNTPYRKALNKREAIEELERGKNKQFDPVIVNTFVEALNKPKNKFNALLLLPLTKLRYFKNTAACLTPLQSAAAITGVTLILSFGAGKALADKNNEAKANFLAQAAETKIALEMKKEDEKSLTQEDIITFQKETNQKSLANEIAAIFSKNVGDGADKTSLKLQTKKQVQTKAQIINQRKIQPNISDCSPQNQYCESQDFNSNQKTRQEREGSPSICPTQNPGFTTSNDDTNTEENRIFNDGNNSNNRDEDMQNNSSFIKISERESSKH